MFLIHKHTQCVWQWPPASTWPCHFVADAYYFLQMFWNINLKTKPVHNFVHILIIRKDTKFYVVFFSTSCISDSALSLAVPMERLICQNNNSIVHHVSIAYYARGPRLDSWCTRCTPRFNIEGAFKKFKIWIMHLLVVFLQKA